jgi:hypothetical protein
MPWMEWYDGLAKPGWTPAPATIGLIWQILYPIILVTFGFVFVQALRRKLPWSVAVPFAINLGANLIFHADPVRPAEPAAGFCGYSGGVGDDPLDDSGDLAVLPLDRRGPGAVFHLGVAGDGAATEHHLDELGTDMSDLNHEHYMRRAIELAANMPDQPFAAVIVDRSSGQIVAEGWNKSSINPTWHGEIDAINRLSELPVQPSGALHDGRALPDVPRGRFVERHRCGGVRHVDPLLAEPGMAADRHSGRRGGAPQPRLALHTGRRGTGAGV